jgi:nicotinamidase-related amidase
MSAVINLSEFKEQRASATLVLVDMHQDFGACAEDADSPDWSRAVANCRAALRHARALGFPVAFTRRIVTPNALWATPEYPRWIDGFEPRRSDMIFDRQLPSCYANNEFAQMVDRIGGVYVIAGLFAEGACLSTAIDAFHRDHRITFLADASASRARQDVPAEAMHKAVAGIMSLYAYVGGTQPWIHATSPRVGASR